MDNNDFRSKSMETLLQHTHPMRGSGLPSNEDLACWLAGNHKGLPGAGQPFPLLVQTWQYARIPCNWVGSICVALWHRECRTGNPAPCPTVHRYGDDYDH